MGAYAPAPLITPALMDTIEKLVIQPTIEGMAAENSPYRGVLYAGVIITKDGPKVIEYNCRFGDPETQAVLPLLEGDLGEIMLACTNGTLERTQLKTSPKTALCVVIASGGYPGSYEKGKIIHGLAEAARIEGAHIFHAGTKQADGDILSAGGRVLGVTGTGDDFIQARKRAYAATELIHFENSFYRTDIGAKALKHFTTST
jgi:phosphoribosylamine--glycine ligase